jgi:hypothetical protein
MQKLAGHRGLRAKLKCRAGGIDTWVSDPRYFGVLERRDGEFSPSSKQVVPLRVASFW